MSDSVGLGLALVTIIVGGYLLSLLFKWLEKYNHSRERAEMRPNKVSIDDDMSSLHKAVEDSMSAVFGADSLKLNLQDNINIMGSSNAEQNAEALRSFKILHLNTLLKTDQNKVTEIINWIKANIRMPWDESNTPKYAWSSIGSLSSILDESGIKGKFLTHYFEGDRVEIVYIDSANVSFKAVIYKDDLQSTFEITEINREIGVDDVTNIEANLLIIDSFIRLLKLTIRKNVLDQFDYALDLLITLNPKAYQHVLGERGVSLWEIEQKSGLLYTQVNGGLGDIKTAIARYVDYQGVENLLTLYDVDSPLVESEIIRRLQSPDDTLDPVCLYYYLIYKRQCVELGLKDCLLVPKIAQGMLMQLNVMIYNWWKL